MTDGASTGSQATRWDTATPWLVATVFPLSVWLAHFGEAPHRINVFFTLAFTWIVCGLIVAACYRWLRRGETRAIAATLIILNFFTYGHAHWALMSLGVRHIWLVFAYVGFTGLIAVWLRHASAALIFRLVRLARVVAALMICLTTASLAKEIWYAGTQTIIPPVVVAGSDSQGPRPDIYFILVDGYARSDMLLRYAGYDNSGFEEALAQRGFKIRSEAKSNYSQTRFSVSSTLNMQYLALPADSVPTSADSVLLTRIRDSKAAEVLRSHGYYYRYVGSAFAPLESSSLADENSRDWMIPAYFATFLSTTICQPPMLAYQVPSRIYLSNLQTQLQRLAEVPQDDQPCFTFAHVMLPHPPFAFCAEGLVPEKDYLYPPNEPYDSKVMKAYVSQIDYLNARLLEIVDSIRPGEAKPIIIIQADHGGGILGEPDEPGTEQVAERLAIFSAIHAPESITRELSSSVTPVNHFRILFRELFGAPLENLPDRSFFYSDRLIELVDEKAPQSAAN